MLGGTWLTALSGDMGHGIFDGANLVANFESINPANTHWNKGYNVYSKVDTEGERFLDFETWWGGPVLLNAEEMQWIADNLFVGNRLYREPHRGRSAHRPSQYHGTDHRVLLMGRQHHASAAGLALGLDLYGSEREIAASGQTIVYTMHQNIGHLGIFVSGKVAAKEHGEFVTCMDMIDVLPPGLYEAVITEVDENTANPELVEGKYLFRLETRTLDHIRALGGNEAADDPRFATAARVSDINLELYGLLWRRRADRGDRTGGRDVRAAHPNRLRFRHVLRPESPDDASEGAGRFGPARSPVSKDNPLLAMERATSSWITMPGDVRRISRFHDRGRIPEHLRFAAAPGARWARCAAGRTSPG